MIRKDLEEKYKFVGKNEDLTLFRKNGGATSGLKYCGNIALRRGKILFRGVVYPDLESLDAALMEWEKTLPYPVDTYCPLIRESYRVYERIIWYLEKKMLFRKDRESWDGYIRNIGPNAKIRFSFSRDTENEKTRIISSFGGMNFDQSVSTAEEGIEIIDSVVNGVVLMMAKDMVDLISTCGEKIATDIDTYILTNENVFGFKKVGFTELMIDRLEKVLKQLKEE